MKRLGLLVSLSAMLSSVASAGPELQRFWDAVYAPSRIGDETNCEIESDAPAKCQGSEHVSDECLKYLVWTHTGSIQCPGFCGNASRVVVERGVLKFDVDYIGPNMNPDARHGDPPEHYADRRKQTRHFEIPFDKGIASIGKYANTKHAVDLDLTFAISPPVKGVDRDGRHFTDLVYDKVKFTGNWAESMGRCDAASYTSDSGRGGTMHVDFLARGHEDSPISCEVLLYGPGYKQGSNCGNYSSGDDGGNSSGNSSAGTSSGGGGACKNQCRTTAGECRRSCHGQSATCASDCNRQESACTNAC